MDPVINEPNAVRNRIETLRSEIDGQLSDKNRLVDHLLDLRLEFDSSGLTALIDELLVEIPGRSVVENSWWSGALDRLSLAAEPTPI